MIYFFANVLVHGLISLLLLIFLLKAYKVNQDRKNKHGIGFFAPFLIALILLVQLALFTLPRILDVSDVIRSDYRQIEGEVEHVAYFNNVLIINGNTYYYNPMTYKPHVGDVLRFSVTSHSGYISEMYIFSEE